MASLPYTVLYEYVPFEDSSGRMNGSYIDLIYQVYLGNYDAVVGDVTITPNRSLYVDFTVPYTVILGMSMVVPIKDDCGKSAWIFLRPLTTELWLATATFFIFTGFVVWAVILYSLLHAMAFSNGIHATRESWQRTLIWCNELHAI